MSDEVTPTPDDGADDAGTANPDARPPDFKDLNDARLRANWEKLDKDFGKLKEKPTTPDTLKIAADIRDQQSKIAKEMHDRAAAAQALQQEMAQLEGADVSLPEIAPPPEKAEDGEVTAGDAPAAAPAQVPALAANAAPSAAQVAAARDPQGSGTKLAAGTTKARQKAPWVAAAAANDGSVQFGAPIDLASLGDQINQGGRRKTRHETILASLLPFSANDGELLSDLNGRPMNDRLVAEAVEAWEARQPWSASHGAKTAAICDPLDIIREIPNPGRSQETPFASSLPFRGAGRLGFQFTRALAISTMAAGATIWTDTDQASVDETDPDTWKAVVDVTCGTPIETTAEELVWGLRYEESTDISAPERVADSLNALMTVEKRVREGYLLRRFDLLGSGATFTTPSIGAMPDIIEIMYRRIEAAMYAERLELPGCTIWIPPGLVAALTVDRVRKAYGIERSAGDVLAEWKASLPDGVNIIQLRDISDNLDADGDIADETVNFGAGETLAAPAAAATAMAHDPCGTFRVRWGWPQSLIAYSTGMTNFGVLRDAALIRQNKVIQFGREFLGLDKHGTQATGYVDFTLSTSGIRGALLTTEDSDSTACS